MNCLLKSYDYSGDGIELLDFFKDEPHLFFLDSSLKNKIRGRYSFLGFNPFEVFQSKSKDALQELREKFLPFKFAAQPQPPFPFFSGIVGYLGYDYGLYQEKIRLRAKDDLHLPHCFFGFYDCAIAIDHFKRKLYVSSSALPQRRKQAVSQWESINKRLREFLNGRKEISQNRFKPHSKDKISLSCNFTKQQYMQAVKKALEFIRCGDIYQVNLSQRFAFDPKGAFLNPVELYKALRIISPSYFTGYLDCGYCQVLSSSPERYLSLKKNVVQTQPMKGTRPRGRNQNEDRILKRDILDNPKDRAELLMITDLERNDLGRVCRFGSVKVKAMRAIEEYKTVFQTTSTVEGILKKGKDGFDVLKASFPGGSITGCPKIRAMEIIEKLEPTRRAIYTGALGYMSFSGNMDFSILIRTLLILKGKIYFQVGSGIVADSKPEEEYKETLVKAKAMRNCLADVFLK